SLVPQKEPTADRASTYKPLQTLPMLAEKSEINSVHIGPTGTMVSTIRGEEQLPQFTLTRLGQPDDTNLALYVAPCVHILFQPRDCTAIWSSASSPWDGSVAVGTSNSVILVNETLSTYISDTRVVPPQRTDATDEPRSGDNNIHSVKNDSDVLAVEFLSPPTLAAGLRNGRVELVDRRTRSEDKTLSIRHPSSVSHIKRLDERYVVVCGLENSLCMYDLRFSHPPSPSKEYAYPTRPVVEYEHENEYRLDLGFDIDCDAGLIAAGKTAISLSSIYSTT
ncbi:MAG: hypothetical protein M1837_002942, partial [Sclerophora amabilis]